MSLQSRRPPLLFQTSIDGQPRTCGAVTWDFEPHAGQMRALATLAHHNAKATARGKWANIRGGRGEIFQVGLDGAASRAACGHATAALATALARSTFKVVGPGGCTIDVTAEVNGFCVSQAWSLRQGGCAEFIWRDRPVVRIDTLNSYAIVGGDLPPETSPERARQELVGDALAAKLVLVTSSAEGAFVRFFNSNGAHGAAPMTGLASLAIARSRVPWLADLIGDGRVSYCAGGFNRSELLPRTEPAPGNRVLIDLPTTDVTFRPAMLEEIAA